MREILCSIGISIFMTVNPGSYSSSDKNPPSGSGDQSNNGYIVKIDNFSFSPATLNIPAGTRVTWLNQDDVPHTVVSMDKRIVSPPLDTDDRFSYEFSAPGTYSYYCSIHPHMTAKVIVK